MSGSCVENHAEERVRKSLHRGRDRRCFRVAIEPAN